MKILFKNAGTLDRGPIDLLTDGAFIHAIAKTGEPIPEAESADRVIDCTGRLMMPGLYNCHTHAAMTLFRGYGEDLPLQRWLEERIFPAEDLLTDRAVYDASLWAIAEMLKNGIVSFTDMYFFCENTARAVEETGIKANISRSLVSFDPDADLYSDSRFLEAKSLFEHWHETAGGRIKIDMALHAEYTNVERYCRQAAEFTASIGARMHIHLSETQKEHEECKARRNGRTPAAFFCDCGLLDSPTTAAHCVWVSEEDMDILHDKRVFVAHNPVSNLKLGSGVMPLSRMRTHGVDIALGTDGAASNNTLDILKEMYIAAILHKGVERDPSTPSASYMIEAATRTGARSQGRDDCGLLKPGCRADLILLDLTAIHNIPCYDPAYAAVYSANASDVRLTMVDGRILYENGEFTTIDMEKLRSDMRYTCANYFKA